MINIRRMLRENIFTVKNCERKKFAVDNILGKLLTNASNGNFFDEN